MLTLACTRPNRFYNDFDSETRGLRSTEHNRTPFQVDRDRIIHSYAFRRLQAKTQVFKPGEYDFYRTRLTHTIEVAQIGRSICRFLSRHGELLDDEYQIDEDLVEAVCLAHDLGHPPFGHAGEKALNVLMARFGGFEGNAQTLRLLTETMWPNTRDGGRQGMAPTRGLLDGVLKYKRTTDGSESDSKFIYVEQIEIVDFVHGLSGTVPSKLKSLECQIMDWADEIAYSVGDVIDGFNARFITIDRLKRWNNKDRDEALVKKLIDAFENTGSDSRFAAKTIGECIEACSLTSASSGDWTPKSDRYRYHLYIDPPMKRTVKCLKAISLDMVFRSPAVEQLEYKAKRILNDLFNTLGEVYMPAPPFKRHLLSTEVEKILTKACCENARARILCDQISGMSDEYAVRMHRRLHEPEFGSIADIVE